MGIWGFGRTPVPERRSPVRLHGTRSVTPRHTAHVGHAMTTYFQRRSVRARRTRCVRTGRIMTRNDIPCVRVKTLSVVIERLWKPLRTATTIYRTVRRVRRRPASQTVTLCYCWGGGNTERLGPCMIYALHSTRWCQAPVLLGGSIALTDLGCDLDL